MKKLLLPGLTNNMATGPVNENPTPDNSFALALYHPLATFLAGFRFLTIIPVSWNQDKDGRFFKASLIWFPILGLFIGGVTVLAVFFLVGKLPIAVTTVFAMLLLAGLSGCLHLDGLADSFDGLLSSRPRSRALEIMRDSHIGAMGVIALFFVLLGKYAALSSLSGTALLQALLLVPMAGRTAIVLTMAILPYARSGDGLGLLFYSTGTRRIAILTTLCCLVISGLVSFSSLCIVLVGILVIVILFGIWCYSKLGGATGDTLGAVCELTELSVAVGFCFL